jgi:hypothetical protein
MGVRYSYVPESFFDDAANTAQSGQKQLFHSLDVTKLSRGRSSKGAPLRWSRVALYLFILRTSFVAPYSPEGVPWNIFRLKRRVRSQNI